MLLVLQVILVQQALQVLQAILVRLDQRVLQVIQEQQGLQALQAILDLLV